MNSTRLFLKPVAALFALVLVLNAAVLAKPFADDRSDAWESVSKMIKFIGMGEASSVEKAGNDALGSLDKAVDKEENSGKKDKLRDARSQVREALSHAAKGEWPYAEGAAKRALQLIEDAK